MTKDVNRGRGSKVTINAAILIDSRHQEICTIETMDIRRERRIDVRASTVALPPISIL